MTPESTGNGTADVSGGPAMAGVTRRAGTGATAGSAGTGHAADRAGTSSTADSAGTGAAGRPEDPAVDAWRGLLVAHSRLVPAVEADLRAAGQVPLSWYDVLLELNAAPERRLRMSELGQRVVLSRTRVSRIVDELAAAGLAERRPDQADGRSSFAVLTAAGRDALRRAWPVYREAIRRHLAAGLTASQCRELAALLDQVIKGAAADTPVTVTR
jgi:DNA-binding MarR family transcriptional regulator